MDFSEGARCPNSRPLYCSNIDRPALDPMVLFNMLFLRYLFGIRSERQPLREIQVNVAYRCQQGQQLIYHTINRLGRREYNPTHCKDRPLLSQCTRSANHAKVLTRPIWQDSKDRTES